MPGQCDDRELDDQLLQRVVAGYLASCVASDSRARLDMNIWQHRCGNTG